MSAPEPGPAGKMLANIRHLRKSGAGEDRIKQEIAYWAPRIADVSKKERALNPAERLAAAGSLMGSGATLGTLDEIVGLFDEDTKQEQRVLQKQIREDEPVDSFGFEVVGSLANPLRFVKTAAKAAPWIEKVGRVMAEGAVQGGIAGGANAEGGLVERIEGVGKGVATGSVAAGVLGGALKAAGATVGRAAERFGLRPRNPERTMEEIAERIPDEDVAAARGKLSELSGRRLADETTVADVLPQGEGALRQAATSNRAVRKQVDEELRQRSNRLSNRAEERFSEYTGTQRQSAQRSIEDLVAEQREAARPLYRQAAEEAYAFDAAPVPAVTEKLKRAIELPFVQKEIARMRTGQRAKWTDRFDDDFELLDTVYKKIGYKIRKLSTGGKMTPDEVDLYDDLVMQRGELREALVARSPTYGKALGTFADDASGIEAFKRGADPSTPADVIPSEMAALDAGEAALYREGKAGSLRPKTSNPDLGEFARFRDVLDVFSDPERAAKFRATFGPEKYREYLKDLLSMAGLQRMRGGAGESTTVDKLVEQLEADPERVAGLVKSLIGGNPLDIMAQASRFDKVIGRLGRSRAGQEQADFLLQRGDDKVKAALDLVERLRREGKLPRRRNPGEFNFSGTLSREAGAIAGRP